jgi:hypothetical protein
VWQTQLAKPIIHRDMQSPRQSPYCWTADGRPLYLDSGYAGVHYQERESWMHEAYEAGQLKSRTTAAATCSFSAAAAPPLRVYKKTIAPKAPKTPQTLYLTWEHPRCAASGCGRAAVEWAKGYARYCALHKCSHTRCNNRVAVDRRKYCNKH